MRWGSRLFVQCHVQRVRSVTDDASRARFTGIKPGFTFACMPWTVFHCLSFRRLTCLSFAFHRRAPHASQFAVSRCNVMAQRNQLPRHHPRPYGRQRSRPSTQPLCQSCRRAFTLAQPRSRKDLFSSKSGIRRFQNAVASISAVLPCDASRSTLNKPTRKPGLPALASNFHSRVVFLAFSQKTYLKISLASREHNATVRPGLRYRKALPFAIGQFRALARHRGQCHYLSCAIAGAKLLSQN